MNLQSILIFSIVQRTWKNYQHAICFTDIFFLIWLIQSGTEFRKSSRLSGCSTSCQILHFAQVGTRPSHTWTTSVTNGAFPSPGWATQSLGKLISEKSRKQHLPESKFSKKTGWRCTQYYGNEDRATARSWITNETWSIFSSAEYRLEFRRPCRVKLVTPRFHSQSYRLY